MKHINEWALVAAVLTDVTVIPAINAFGITLGGWAVFVGGGAFFSWNILLRLISRQKKNEKEL